MSIITRTSYGPAAFAFDPESTIATAQPLVYYNGDHPTLGNYGISGSHPDFNGTTRITGIVFPHGTSSVLFFGVTGLGNWCYGEATCAGGDPMQQYKGDHAPPYVGYVWAYDANELAAVRSGSMQPWSVVPYKTWQLPQLGDVQEDFGVGGAAYDPATGRIFVSKLGGDGTNPLIYVYKVNNSTSTKTPNPPSAVTIK